MRSAILAVTLLAVGCASAPQRPVRNVSARRHPNLAAAQRDLQAAFDAVSRAQSANEWDLGGHAKKAKELLDEANSEIKLAAEASNVR
jgi:DNA-binding transcriptional regulator PaaX